MEDGPGEDAPASIDDTGRPALDAGTGADSFAETLYLVSDEGESFAPRPPSAQGPTTQHDHQDEQYNSYEVGCSAQFSSGGGGDQFLSWGEQAGLYSATDNASMIVNGARARRMEVLVASSGSSLREAFGESKSQDTFAGSGSCEQLRQESVVDLPGDGGRPEGGESEVPEG